MELLTPEMELHIKLYSTRLEGYIRSQFGLYGKKYYLAQVSSFSGARSLRRKLKKAGDATSYGLVTVDRYLRYLRYCTNHRDGYEWCRKDYRSMESYDCLCVLDGIPSMDCSECHGSGTFDDICCAYHAAQFAEELAEESESQGGSA